METETETVMQWHVELRSRKTGGFARTFSVEVTETEWKEARATFERWYGREPVCWTDKFAAEDWPSEDAPVELVRKTMRLYIADLDSDHATPTVGDAA